MGYFGLFLSGTSARMSFEFVCLKNAKCCANPNFINSITLHNLEFKAVVLSLWIPV